MLGLTIVATLAILLPTLWLLIETVSRRRSLWLSLAIPVLSMIPFGFYAYGQGLLGYAVAGKPTVGFTLIHAYADDKAHKVYALVMPDGSTKPRLYAVAGDYAANRKAFSAASARVAQGAVVKGRLARHGDGEEGEFVFYRLPPAGLPIKG